MSRLRKRRKSGRGSSLGRRGDTYYLVFSIFFFYFTSDTMVRMGGGHLLCLIMKPHFFLPFSVSLCGFVPRR